MDFFIWLGIVFCITQSAMFSGLNLAFFSVSKLRLELEVSQGNKHAIKVLQMRGDANFLLTTILWGNVGINVLLTLLSNSVMAGMIAFFFSTFLITFLGEIIPQAYFSRHALIMGYYLSPVLRFYQYLLYPITKPCAYLLDRWLGPEAVQFFNEEGFSELLKMHMKSGETDINYFEGKGALNFLALDEIKFLEEGEVIDTQSIIPLDFIDNTPQFPQFSSDLSSDQFLRDIAASGKKWIILTDRSNVPRLAMNADRFLRRVVFSGKKINPLTYCHRPIIFTENKTTLGEIIPRLKVTPEKLGDDVIDEDMVIFWGEMKRIITGADVLGRLLRGIVQHKDIPFRKYKEKTITQPDQPGGLQG